MLDQALQRQGLFAGLLERFGGEGAQQVVHAVPVVPVFGDEMRADEVGQERTDTPQRQRRQAVRVMCGAGCRDSSRNSRAESGANVRYDQLNTARASTDRSVSLNASSVPWASRSSAASATRDVPRATAARAATIASANGSPPHRAMISATASGSAATRSSPSRRARASLASACGQTSSVRRRAPSKATRLCNWWRLVMITRQPGVPGSKGRTWSLSRALSSTTSTLRPASRLRNCAATASTLCGMSRAATPRASRKPLSASNRLHRASSLVVAA
ncbi:hypothetical protein GCM10023194_77290 [Planotetraspora phitsanulokensis]|uniref:Uncharacterized protein n=1 Tax=Planotetraspora phitsanulokensis TaxID=575192 RepID=A0A8J3TYS6_9ACTN|nr:hypothetical protein [Planotetraspora phitsanulokensis]GII35543.1 hypothetical protein Pph01_05460 [Planotetraspora phitsanulokensis]